MVKIKIIKVNKSGKSAHCEAFNENNITLLKGLMLVNNKDVNEGSIIKTNFKNCFLRVSQSQDRLKAVWWIVLKEEISQESADVIYSLTENGLPVVNKEIQKILDFEIDKRRRILLEINGIYLSYIFKTVDVPHNLTYNISQSSYFPDMTINLSKSEIKTDEIDEDLDYINYYKKRLELFNEQTNLYSNNRNQFNNSYKRNSNEFVKIYGLNSELKFGKYQSKKLSILIKEDSDYICYCITKLDHFAICSLSLTLLSSFIDLKIFKKIAIINTYKLLLLDIQRNLMNNIYKDKLERWESNRSLYKLGNEIAFEGDSSNLWNID